MQTMMLRSMQQAVYTPDNSGHFGLAYVAYTHFTSPIRRYPDLLVHRVIKACLNNTEYVPVLNAELASVAGGEAPATAGATKKRGKGSSAKRASGNATASAAYERRADDASRDVEAWLKCQFMRDRVGEEYPGRITGVAPFGVFVTLDALHVEGMVHVSELGSEYFQFNDAGHALVGERTGTRYCLTDSIRVQVSRVDLEARRIEFRLAAATVRPPSKKSGTDSAGGSKRERKVRKAAPAASEKVRKVRAERLKAKTKAGRKRTAAKPKVKSGAKAKTKGKKGKSGRRAKR
jgi:ribonuclease R